MGLRVGFIGLGSQGAPMAQALIDHGFATSLWARRTESLLPFEGTAAVAATPAELAAQVDVLGICVLADADVEEVLLGPSGVIEGVRPGTIVAIHSTVHPAACVRMTDALAPIGAEVLDAPVSGGGVAAADGRLLVMVGGARQAFDRAEPVFRSFGNPVVHLGAPGTGQIAKLVNNLLFTCGLAAAHLAVELGAACGVDPGALVTTLEHASSRSYPLEIYGRIREGFGDPTSPVAGIAALLGKDVGIMEGMLDERGLDGALLLRVAGEGLQAMAGSREGDTP